MAQPGRISRQDLVRQFSTVGYDNAEDATWHCDVCGETVPPKYIQQLNRHIKLMCKCERDEVDRRKKEERDRFERAVRAESIRNCYEWLGREFSAASMALRTFDAEDRRFRFDANEQPQAMHIAEQWMENPHGVLIFHGKYGTGKSHLMACVCNELRSRGRKCRWATAPKLFQAMSAAMDNQRIGDGIYHENWTDIARKAASCDILFLDDVDKLKESMWREEVYHSIMDDRTNDEKPIALTINDIRRLPECMGESVADRLCIGRIAVPFVGESYRKRLIIRGS